MTSSKTSSRDAPFKVLLGILGYWTLLIWGLFEVGTPTRPPWGRPCQNLCSNARRSGRLYTLFDQEHDLVFFFFEHQTSHVVCFNTRGVLYECVFDTLLFSSSYRPVGKPVSHHVVTRPTFSSLFFFWIILAILSATMLGYYSMSASSMPSEFFRRRFDLLKSASYRLSLDLASIGKTTNRSTSKLICFFFLFGPTCMLFDLSIALRLHHHLSKVVAPTPCSGACETWVPLGPHRSGSRPSPTSGSGLLEDPPTYQWA
jgi:hypothetical protein